MSSSRLSVLAPQTASLITRDGVRLVADVYRPEGLGRYPVLLMRQPYGRQIASTLCYAHPRWYASHGYIVVIQDVRGRGDSEGEFRVFVDDADDGVQTIEWAAGLEGSTGAVGMYGFSYQGVTQLLAAAGHVPALKAIAPAMIGWDLRGDWAYENDAFCLAAGLGWGVQMAAEGARLAGDRQGYAALYTASRDLPLYDDVPARPAVLQDYRRHDRHYFDWLNEPAGSPYWDSISPSAKADALTSSRIPALFVSGWYDSHLPGTAEAYRRYEAAGAESRLVVGPWAHFPWSRHVGRTDFGVEAIGEIDPLQIAWFDYWLKGVGEAPIAAAPVQLFDMGTRHWSRLSAWPVATATWSLNGGGRTALDERDGVLSPAPSKAVGVDTLVHDPWRPAPSLGGAFASPAGPADRTVVDARPDVLTYTSRPLSSPLSLAGTATVTLAASCDGVSFDLACVLSRVTADDRAFHITDGYRHFASAPCGPAIVPLRPTCITLAAGTRLRLSVAAASFPNFPVNPGDGQDPTAARLGDARVLTITLHHDGEGSCRIDLPVTA